MNARARVGRWISFFPSGVEKRLAMSSQDAWLPYYKPLSGGQAALRLVTFHWAGGSASAYNGPAWRELPAGCELLAVQLPGREKRNGEPTPKTAQEAAKLAAKGLSKFFAAGSVPTVIFAHSMVSSDTSAADSNATCAAETPIYKQASPI